MSETVNEQQTVKSHSERRILEGCIYLMQRMYDTIQEQLELGYTPDEIFENEDYDGKYYFRYELPLEEIVGKLFLSHTLHGGMTSRLKKVRELGFDTDEEAHFVIEARKDRGW